MCRYNGLAADELWQEPPEARYLSALLQVSGRAALLLLRMGAACVGRRGRWGPRGGRGQWTCPRCCRLAAGCVAAGRVLSVERGRLRPWNWSIRFRLARAERHLHVPRPTQVAYDYSSPALTCPPSCLLAPTPGPQTLACLCRTALPPQPEPTALAALQQQQEDLVEYIVACGLVHRCGQGVPAQRVSVWRLALFPLLPEPSS